MKKTFMTAIAAFLLMSILSAYAAQAPGVFLILEDERISGAVIDALPLADGMLVTGFSEYEDEGWMAYLNEDGSIRWLLEEEGSGIFSCLGQPGSGGVSALVKRSIHYDDYGNPAGRNESFLAKVNTDGNILELIALPGITLWLISHAEGFYAIGTVYGDGDGDGEEPQGLLASLDSAGSILWSYVYTNDSYSGMTFRKGVMAADSLILIGDGHNAAENATVGLIHHVDLDGQVLWTSEAALGNDSKISDICVSLSGLIAGTYANIEYDGFDGFPSDRQGSVFCLDMDGVQQWEHLLADSRTADYVLPVSGGFLIGSRGLNVEESPWQGDGWLMLMDETGNVVELDSLLDINGGKLELMGIADNLADGVLLCGVLLEEPGYIGAPFLFRLSIPQVE